MISSFWLFLLFMLPVFPLCIIIYTKISPTAEFNEKRRIIGICYIASAETKRDWLIRGHVTLDKCNVSLGQQVKNCCPATMH